LKCLAVSFVSMVLLICLHLLLPQLLSESTKRTNIGTVTPLLKACVKDKRRERKPRESVILFWIPYKTFIESREKEKARKMKGKTKRQLKGLEAA
jgi:hypothetical protein